MTRQRLLALLMALIPAVTARSQCHAPRDTMSAYVNQCFAAETERQLSYQFEKRLSFAGDYSDFDFEGLDAVRLRDNHVRKLVVQEMETGRTYSFLFDRTGRLEALSAPLNGTPLYTADTGFREMVDDQGKVVARVPADGSGWGLQQLFYLDTDGNTLSVSHYYLDGRFQAIDSSLFLKCPNSAAEAGVRLTVRNYRKGSYLNQQNDYFNRKYFNRDYRQYEGTSGDYYIFWEPSCDFRDAYGTSDSAFFTKKLPTDFGADSFYCVRQQTHFYNGDFVEESKLPAPAFSEPYFRAYIRRRPCGTGVSFAAQIQASEFSSLRHLPNGMPSESLECRSGQPEQCHTKIRFEYEYYGAGGER